MTDREVKVTLTLRGHVADRLRAMCHKRGITASHLVDKWIFAHDDSGEPKKTTSGDPYEDALSQLLGGKRR